MSRKAHLKTGSKQRHLVESVGADPGLEWLQRINVDDILWQGVPDDSASRVERVLIALDMAEWLNKTLILKNSTFF